jgi:DNA-binding transcriptional LysR family regulator
MLRMNLSPADIEAFLSVAETGSFSRSGLDLGLSQPAMSARVQHLEQMLGVKLFHRTTRRVTITDAGERLRVRMQHTMAELRGMLQELDDELHLRRGRISVGASPTVAACFLANVICRFRRDQPDIEMILHDDFYGRALDRVLRGEVDLAVVPFEPDNDLYAFELLFEDRFLLAVPSNHRLATCPRVTLDQLAGETLISMPPQSAAYNTFKRAFAEAGLEFSPAFQTRNPLTNFALVKAGFGIGFITELLLGTQAMTGIVLVPVEANLTRNVGIATAQDAVPSPAAQAFCAALRAAATLQRPALGAQRTDRAT